MSTHSFQPQDSASPDEIKVRTLYQQLLDSWNKRSAGEFAALFTPDGSTIGFDGSMLDGPAEIESEFRQIFANHPTAAYVAKVRSVRFLAPDVAILRAVAGMVPPGQSDLNPAVNAVQTLVAGKHDGKWRVVLFQNTPAQFHGRPELVQQLTEELRQLLK
ncbi:MAG: SgcJ/EcaC family oxidoreductase [Ktedonobacteraceae bacterium]